VTNQNKLSFASKKVERDIWQARIAEALDYASRYGTIDGAHHKTWVIDQMVRVLVGWRDYEDWVAKHEGWQEGIAP